MNVPTSATAGSRPGPKPTDTSCATTGSVDFGVDLAGSGWKFTTGDDTAWSDPSFADTTWRDWSVPDNWGDHADLSGYDGYAWYRKSFTLPARPAGVTDSTIIAALGKIDDADQVFLNGTEIGHTGGFPPSFDSTWEVPREYYPADGLLRWGATNVLAVRIYDGTGGGGFYQGPVGLFSKARLRALAGVTGTAATRTQLAQACAVLSRQHRAVAAGDVRGYAATLASGFFHQGDTAERRITELRALLKKGKVTLTDSQAEVFVDAQGRLVVDTIRTWTGLPTTRELLYLDPRKLVEIGDHARFFRDDYDSAAMKRRAQFNVYLPKGYTRTTAKRFPVVYMLNGFNGSNIEWEARDIDTVLDKLGVNAIVVFPDGDSGWYVDTSAGNFRSMIVNEIVPMVDRVYRTIPDRDHRGISGVSMGGQGAFTLGLKNPDVFSSIASHMGALSLAPLVGTTEERAANAGLRPLTLVAGMSAAELNRHRFYFDGGDSDEYRFGAAAQQMSTALAAKGVKHDYQLGAGRHDDAYWMPKLDRSFALHAEQFAAHPVR
ncbi:putative esterase [Actinoplanes missouriensis 431]|uniref:Putative esterase n=1 Tax=Actinoplanes missouriensis (strain ATCC 14538 / DSM 43046 / CBS 188.64 / JCM 3121 / NBRC 102363 / NCIMB 12654 / NRRL B-3342 / UNCC 431) TaxID=512565 RepID=I0H0E9_ACTM4|nr:alpha/beta hydrolase-fold protein [Actinoplanes missouriensis]BAL86486.1 putative esterase [Actinoplanes missouriensis 431]